MSLVLLFVTPGSLEPSVPAKDNRKRRKVLAECKQCGFVADTVGDMDAHTCSSTQVCNYIRSLDPR